MNTNLKQSRFIKTRLTLFTLIAFSISIWSLAYYASQTLYGDMKNLMGEQQFSTAETVASVLNHELDDRIKGLEKVAGMVSPDTLSNMTSMQEFLGRYPVLQNQFNAGIYATNLDGTAIASIPVSVGRIGINYMDRDHIAAAIKNGKASVSKPVIGKKLNVPVISIGVPICDTHGKVIGALSGVIDLSVPNFMDLITDNRYAKTGGLLLVAPQYRLVVTATDKSRIMQPLPAAGVNPLIDRYIAGYEGYTILVNSRGVEELASVKRIPVAGWYLAVTMPTKEAFAPIHTMQRRIVWAAFLLTLIVCGLTWWMLRRLFSPIFATVAKIGAMTDSGQPLQPLPVIRHDELGQLIDGFNHALKILAQREETLRSSESHYRSLFDNSLIGVTVTNREFIITDANDAFCKMLEYSKDELIGKMRFTDISHPDDADISIEMVRKLMTHEIGHYSLEKRYLTKTGKTINGLLYVRGQYDHDGEYEGTTGSILDITEYKRADESLRVSEEKYRNLFNNSEIAIFRSRIDGSEVLDVNQKFLDMVGLTREEALGKPSAILWADPKEREEMVRRLSVDGRVSGYEYKMLNQQGGVRNCLTSLVLYREQGILEGSIIDMTELKQAEKERLKIEQQLLHAQKLESLGVLAGGIAHDFNNILTSIIGNADLALMRMNPESPAIDNLHKIEQASVRAADLAKQMLAYSGKGKFIVEHLDMNRLLEEMLHMLEVSISKKAVLRLNLTPQLPSVEADATQMRQIVMNLVINASEAIGDKSGVIAITTGCMECDKTYLKNIWLDENIKEGLYVYLEVADTGCGMDNMTQAKLFDPFFTTKFTGRGLGMAAVLGIIRGHKGAINVYSVPEKGTTFKILLPASNRPAEIFDHDSSTGDWKGEGKVLLVDDEETIRGIGKEMLQEFGFTTITANDGREAIEIFKQNPDITFVILDLTMPHMDGEQCFQELKKVKPDVKVFISSGFSEHEVTQKFVGKGLTGFIQKPYKMSVLKEAIQKI